MNPLKYIQKNWNFEKSIEENALIFETRQKKEKKAKFKQIVFALFVIGLSLLFGNPTLSFILLIGAVTFGSEYVFRTAALTNTHTCIRAIDSTHFVVAYEYHPDNYYGYVVIGTIANGNEISYGTARSFRAGTEWLEKIDIAIMDSTHFVICYSYTGGSYFYGRAIWGTISGTSINLGSYQSIPYHGEFHYGSICVLDSTHTVISYYGDSTDYGACIVASWSGGGATFGSYNTFNAETTYDTCVRAIDSTHFVVAYEDYNGGTNKGYACIGTVSGTTITGYGSVYEFNAAGIGAGNNFLEMQMLDSTHLVIAYMDQGDSSKGKAIIGVISGTTVITFGTEYLFNNASTAYISVGIIDSTHFVISYKTYNSEYGYSIIGTVSNGDDIAFADAVAFNSAVTSRIGTTAVDSTHIVVSFCDEGNSSYGTAIVGVIQTSIAYTMSCSTGSYALTGVNVNMIKALHIITIVGEFVLTGVNVSLSKGKKMVCQVGNYIFTGVDVNFRKSLKMTVAVGEYLLTGVNINLNKGKTMVCEVGNYIVTGIDINIHKSLSMAVTVGEYALTGINIELHKGLSMAVSVGEYIVTGVNVNFKKSWNMIVEAGSYALTGINVNFSKGYHLIADVGVYVLTGIDVILNRGIHMIVSAGSYILTGINVIMGGIGSWKITNQSRNNSSVTNQTKNDSTVSNLAKNVVTFINSMKH